MNLQTQSAIENLQSSIFAEPLHDLLARPVVIVVQVQDDGVERQPLVAADRAAAPDVFQAIEETMKSRADGLDFTRQRVRAFVRRAKRAGSAVLGEVLAEGLLRPATRAGGDSVGEL